MGCRPMPGPARSPALEPALSEVKSRFAGECSERLRELHLCGSVALPALGIEAARHRGVLSLQGDLAGRLRRQLRKPGEAAQ